LFTFRSLDGQPLERARKIRVYHGFGEADFTWGDRKYHVPKEAVVDGQPGG
jgi:hypothetical protein